MKYFLISGANKGIGFSIAEAVLKESEDNFVFLGSRDLERGKKAQKELQEKLSIHDRVETVQIDVLSMSSITSASEFVKSKLSEEQKLQGLVNNAGTINLEDGKNTVDVNFWGLKEMTDSFLPLIAPQGRIVNISSGSAPNFVQKTKEEFLDKLKVSTLSWEEIDTLAKTNPETMIAAGEEFGSTDYYGFSKALVNSYTAYLAKQHPNLIINACTPGFIMTDLTLDNFSGGDQVKAKAMGMKTPEEGATCPMHLLFDALEGNGRFYGSDCKRSPFHKYRSPGSEEYKGE
eukprot:snap_masked-scaffold_31-processed-gene-1.39-mRNA-1 protein AED:0.37 eAED:0.37 QI:0/-1/0/1/-1/1/1/0/288